jgi:predicted transcriptional regulator
MNYIIFEVLASRSRREILKVLYASGIEIPGRVLARETGFSVQQAHNALRQLVSYGVVKCRKFPPTHLFSIDREAPLAVKIEAALALNP